MGINQIKIPLFILRNPVKVVIRSSSRVSVDLNRNVLEKIENKEIKPRQHPGKLKTGQISLPDSFIKGLTKCVGDFPIKALLKEGFELNNYIRSRHPPAEESLQRQKLLEIEAEIDSKFPTPDLSALSQEAIDEYKKQKQAKIRRLLRQRVISWKPINYGSQFEALAYAVARSGKEYATLFKTLTEISRRDPNFKPRSFFDFGSGVGTAMWAAATLWKDTIFEYFNVDSSREMNDLSDMILREGNENKQPLLKNVFYRQFLPSAETGYDLVISAYTLFELPSAKHRHETLMNLWSKCNGYLVIIEEGTRHGFELITEARDIILSLGDDHNVGHVFAPCPHDFECPRLALAEDRTPCNFEASFQTIPLGSNSKHSNGLYSYVVLKRGARPLNEEDNWPRVVRETLIRSRHSICRMCTSKGELREIIFTPSKHGKPTYTCARATKWGERLPIVVGDKFDE